MSAPPPPPPPEPGAAACEEQADPAGTAGTAANVRMYGSGRYAKVRVIGSSRLSKLVVVRDVADGTLWHLWRTRLATLQDVGSGGWTAPDVSLPWRTRNPYLTKMREQWSTATATCVVEETYAEDLVDFLFRSSVLPDDAVVRRIFQQMVCAVRGLHSDGLCCYGLQVESFVVTDPHDMTVRLATLDCVTWEEGPKLEAMGGGSLSYTAPEIISGSGGKPADVWSLGVALYALLSGQLPFDHASYGQAFQSVLDADYSFPAEFPTGAKEVVEMMLVADPVARCSLDDVIATPWFSADLGPRECAFLNKDLFRFGGKGFGDPALLLADIGVCNEAAVEVIGSWPDVPPAAEGPLQLRVVSLPLGATEPVVFDVDPSSTVGGLCALVQQTLQPPAAAAEQS